MFEDLTFEDLMERMLERIDDSYDKRESSPIYAALAPAALELMNIYNALDDMFDECFADTASREYLIRLAASRGIVPYAATEAVVKAEFTPDTIELNAGVLCLLRTIFLETTYASCSGSTPASISNFVFLRIFGAFKASPSLSPTLPMKR